MRGMSLSLSLRLPAPRPRLPTPQASSTGLHPPALLPPLLPLSLRPPRLTIRPPLGLGTNGSRSGLPNGASGAWTHGPPACPGASSPWHGRGTSGKNSARGAASARTPARLLPRAPDPLPSLLLMRALRKSAHPGRRQGLGCPPPQFRNRNSLFSLTRTCCVPGTRRRGTPPPALPRRFRASPRPQRAVSDGPPDHRRPGNPRRCWRVSNSLSRSPPGSLPPLS